jgi:hypothetical protein
MTLEVQISGNRIKAPLLGPDKELTLTLFQLSPL